MIRITCSGCGCGPGRGQLWIGIEGHANYAPEGQDIVCAAVSALYGTLRMQPGVREDVQGEGSVERRTLRPEKAGWRTPAGLREVFAAIAQGLQAIAYCYPEHVEFCNEE